MQKASYFLVVSVLEENGKRLAYPLQVRASENLLHVLKDRPNLVSVNICATKKEALTIANHWNKCYQDNGNFFFGDRLYPASVQKA